MSSERKVRPLKTTNPRLQNLNPIFHSKTQKEDDKIMTKQFLKQAKQSGIVNLSSRGLGFGECRVVSPLMVCLHCHAKFATVSFCFASSTRFLHGYSEDLILWHHQLICGVQCGGIDEFSLPVSALPTNLRWPYRFKR